MKIELNGKLFEGSGTNSVENVVDGVRRAAGECAAALGLAEGSGAKIVVTEIEGLPGLVFTAEYPPDAAALNLPLPDALPDAVEPKPKPAKKGK